MANPCSACNTRINSWRVFASITELSSGTFVGWIWAKRRSTGAEVPFVAFPCLSMVMTWPAAIAAVIPNSNEHDPATRQKELQPSLVKRRTESEVVPGVTDGLFMGALPCRCQALRKTVVLPKGKGQIRRLHHKTAGRPHCSLDGPVGDSVELNEGVDGTAAGRICTSGDARGGSGIPIAASCCRRAAASRSTGMPPETI